MRWVNHKIIGFAIPFILTRNYLFSFLSAIFSILPDLVEGNRVVLKHRGISHNPFAWLALCLAAYWAITLWVGDTVTSALFTWFVLSIASGVFLHLLADSLTMSGIPLYGDRRLAAKLFRTGSPTEYVISLVILLVLVWLLLPVPLFAETKDILNYMDPLKRVESDQYVSFWAKSFNTILNGLWARLIASVFLAAAFWVGVYRQRFFIGAAFFAVAVAFAYLGSIVRIMFWWV